MLTNASECEQSVLIFPRRQFVDQCRGYAIFAMILVNVLGLFDCMPWMLKHHPIGFSYADHIAPIFIFVVGIGFRMSFVKTVQTEGIICARNRALKRYFTLIGIGVLYGGFNFRAGVWDALTGIGISGLLALPFMASSGRVRFLTAVFYLLLFQCISLCSPYGDWVLHNSINGGPLGALSWVFLLLMGTLAADSIFSMRSTRMFFFFIMMAAVCSCSGWLLRMEWNGVKEFWSFSKFTMSASYTLYAAGLCFSTVSFFYVLCEWIGIVLPHFNILSKNPLVLYLLQAILVLLVRVSISSDQSVFVSLLFFLLIYGICYSTAYGLYRSGKIIKL